ncbi:DUF4430 domain-containing protein [Tepidibacter hydrothermalis]|uniref:DUF4430 domain-containing protein n=1 Tax=Tepidibacter hydrothermalis TaxID=3036126 RepID=A0ABY8ECQ7_9FIRM|nr:DUF4430 domain-containing protein [Tepidibacter hydrothermalis]WFD10706.1 DUF4430 domain-containing protein [Tepidibacter hydrothermalis]
MKMKKFITPVLAASLAFGGFAISANAQDNIANLTLDDGRDFSVVNEIGHVEEIRAIGASADWQTKIEIPDTENIKWTTSDDKIAEVMGAGDIAYVNLVGEGEATITVTYNKKTVTSKIVVERKGEAKNKIANITVGVDENQDGMIQDNEKYIKGGEIELFSLKDELGMSDADVADVLKKDPTALHALLQALEIQNDEEGISDGYDYVKEQIKEGKLSIESEGSYIRVLLGTENNYTKGWQYKINDKKQDRTASIYKLNEGDTVKFEFSKFEW